MATLSLPLAGAARDCTALDAREESVRVCFRLPDGTDWVTELPKAQTVAYAIAVLHRQRDVPMDAVLRFEGRRLLEPLSLCDVGLEGAQTNMVVVEVQE